MTFGTLNCSSTLQRKLHLHCQLPSTCPLCMMNDEDLQHLFFDGHFYRCWDQLLSTFKIQCIFCEALKDNVLQILVGPSLKPKSQLLWSNEVKAILA